MHRYTFTGSLMLGATLTLGACNRAEKMTPGTEVQTQSAQQAATPTSLSGCLKAGEAGDTFVLTTARADGAGDPATYQLVGSKAAGLGEHIGHRVEVTGTVQAQQEVATRSTAQSAQERPAGTSGTPTVQTRAEIEIRRLAVDSVKPLDEKCE